MKVKLTITKSACRSNYHTQGETHIVEDICPPICHELWHVAYPNIMVLQNGGTLNFGDAREKRFEVRCPDQGRVVMTGELVELELIKPTIEMKAAALDFVSEFKLNNESMINGCCGLTRYSDYSEWINYIEQVEKGLVAERVASSTYFAVNTSSNIIVGIIDIRHALPKEHFYSGHIGYSVRPSERKKGYGTEILRLGLEKVKKLNINPILVVCSKSNVASRKVIENNKGNFEKEMLIDGKTDLVYWIEL